jgi:hypothetical protein
LGSRRGFIIVVVSLLVILLRMLEVGMEWGREGFVCF